DVWPIQTRVIHLTQPGRCQVIDIGGEMDHVTRLASRVKAVALAPATGPPQKAPPAHHRIPPPRPRPPRRGRRSPLRKSSITTMSCFLPSSGPGATAPLVIRTRAMRASSKTMPKKDRLASPGEAGTELLKSRSPSAPKYSIIVLALRFPLFSPDRLPPGWSTSVKTAPNPVVVAGLLPPPGTEK